MSFIGTALSLAWWDMSLSLESRSGRAVEPIRVMQELAVWRFIKGSDNRTSMKAVSGEEIEAEVRALVSPSAAPQAGPSITRESSFPFSSSAMQNDSASAPRPDSIVSAAPVAAPAPSFCGKCGEPLSSVAKFCRSCGTPIGAWANPQGD